MDDARIIPSSICRNDPQKALSNKFRSFLMRKNNSDSQRRGSVEECGGINVIYLFFWFTTQRLELHTVNISFSAQFSTVSHSLMKRRSCRCYTVGRRGVGSESFSNKASLIIASSTNYLPAGRTVGTGRHF